MLDFRVSVCRGFLILQFLNPFPNSEISIFKTEPGPEIQALVDSFKKNTNANHIPDRNFL